MLKGKNSIGKDAQTANHYFDGGCLGKQPRLEDNTMGECNTILSTYTKDSITLNHGQPRTIGQTTDKKKIQENMDRCTGCNDIPEICWKQHYNQEVNYYL